MTDALKIEFDSTGVYASFREPSPLWLVTVMDADGPSTSEHGTAQDAEQKAAAMALKRPGVPVHILATVAIVQTSPKVIGTRYDPTKAPPKPDPVMEPVMEDPEFAEVVEPEPGFAAVQPPPAAITPHDPSADYCACAKCVGF